MATNFEGMSNDELRVQMAAYGLPKVPITASTRNILIKRLQNHIKDSSDKSRRETINVIKYSSDDDSDREAAKEKLKKKLDNHKNARRATIAVASPPPPAAPAKSSSRKSLRTTPTKTLIPEPTRHIVANVPVIVEDSDEDMDVQPAAAIVEKRPSVVDRRSKSKTPVTLAKSDVVTTSYKQVVSPVTEIIEDDEEEYESDEKPAPKYNTSSRATLSSLSTARTNYTESKLPVGPRDSPMRRVTTSLSYGEGPRLRETIAPTAYSRPATSTFASNYASSYSAERLAATSIAADPDAGLDRMPYLSDFSKRLARLKAEPLTPRSNSAYHRSTLQTTTNRAAPSSQQYQTEQHTFWDTVGTFFVELEQKYGLKRKCLILGILLAIIFIVVLFWN